MNMCQKSVNKQETSSTSFDVVLMSLFSEAVLGICSSKWVFLKILQSSQESTCVEDSFLIKLQASGL